MIIYNKKVEPTHGTPPATGISSFRSTTTISNISFISGDVEQYFLVTLIVYALLRNILVLFIPDIQPFFFIFQSFLRLVPSDIHIIQISVYRF